MLGNHNALNFLESTGATLPPVVVLFGQQRYLQSLVLDRLTGTDRHPGQQDSEQVDAEAGFAVLLDGTRCEWVDLVDQLSSRSLFGDSDKLVIVRDADELVSKQREKLEDFLSARQPGDVPLILAVTTWPATTRLYKLAEKTGLQIRCEAPTSGTGRNPPTDLGAVAKWLVRRAEQTHGFKLAQDAAKTLFELCDAEFGRSDQELARIALYVADGKPVDRKQVQEIVGGWRKQTMFNAIDAAVEGEAGQALLLMDRLMAGGEHPLALFGQLAWSLRRYSQALRELDRMPGGGRKGSMRDALQRAGFTSFRGDLDRAEPRMRRLGRQRVSQLSRILLEIDRSLKGSHSHEDRGRLALEKLVFWLA